MTLPMTLLIATMLVEQPALSAPPLPSESTEVTASAAHLSANLITIESLATVRVQRNNRYATLGDSEFVSLFSLVPEAQALAKRANEAWRASLVPLVLSSIVIGLSIIPLVAAFVAGALVPGLIIGAAMLLAGVVTVLVVRCGLAPQAKALAAIELHNRLLVERHAVPAGDVVTLDVAFHGGLAYALPHAQ